MESDRFKYLSTELSVLKLQIRQNVNKEELSLKLTIFKIGLLKNLNYYF